MTPRRTARFPSSSPATDEIVTRSISADAEPSDKGSRDDDAPEDSPISKQ